MAPHAAAAGPPASSPNPAATHTARRPLQQRTTLRPSSGTASPTAGSATQTLTANTPRGSSPNENLVLRLRGAHPRSSDHTTESETEERGPRIHWAEDVIDNEGLGRKSSKVCCIYHKTRPVGESSSEDDSSSSSSSDEGGSSDGGSPDDGGARMIGGTQGRKGKRKDHKHGENCAHGKGHRPDNGERRRPSPNAYERMPRYRPQEGGGGGSTKQ